MAIDNTKITDLVPNEKALSVSVNLLLAEKNEIVNSGMTARGPEVDKVANGGPRKGFLQFLNPLATDAVNISNDDINDEGDVGKLTADEFTVLRHDQNYSWGTSDLARMVTQYDAQGGIRAGLAQYWATRTQMTTVSSVKGVLASIQAVIAAGAANGASDAAKAAAAQAATLLAGATGTDFTMATAYNATATAGLYADLFNVMIVSPARYAKLQALEANGFIPASKTDTGFANYQGFNLLKSKAFGDTMTVLARNGSIAFGYGTVPNAIEIERKANAGNGAGADILHSRASFVSHVQGTNYEGPVAPTLAQLEDAASWSLKVPAEQFGFRFISHKA